jgi:transcription antitermination factor NusG
MGRAVASAERLAAQARILTGCAMLMGREDDWFILRTAGRSTLPLAASLAEDGFECWTPVRTQRIRIPRMNIKREVKLPLLPSFIFARATHLHELLELAQMAEKPRRDPHGGRSSRPAHRDFSVFHYLDRIPMIADRSLDPVRTKEREIVPKKDAPRFDRGAKVRVGSGAFEGLKGKVERCADGHALVIFGSNGRRVKIATWLLAEDEANTSMRVAKAA